VQIFKILSFCDDWISVTNYILKISWVLLCHDEFPAFHPGSYELADLLLSKEAEVDPICENGGAPIHVCAENGHAKVLNLLQHKGDIINSFFPAILVCSFCQYCVLEFSIQSLFLPINALVFVGFFPLRVFPRL
jgi:ankyrin repeat protein